MPPADACRVRYAIQEGMAPDVLKRGAW